MTDINIEHFKIGLANWDRDQQQLVDIRTRVFVDEQQVPVSLEIDGLDPQCQHIKAVNSAAEIVGVVRLLSSHYIGRMCVLKEYRQQGIGGSMLDFVLALARKNNYKNLFLNAQLSALPFYRKFGFVEDSDIFLEAGIAHKHMTLNLVE